MRLKRAGKTALGILIAALVWIAMVPCMFALGVLFALPIYLSHRRNMWWGVGAYALVSAAYMLLLGTLAAVWAGLGILPFLVALRLIREKRPMMGSVLILAGTSLVSMLLGVLVLSLATGQSLIPYLEGVIRAYLSGDSLPAVLRDPLLRMIDLASNGTALLTAEQSLELYDRFEAGAAPAGGGRGRSGFPAAVSFPALFPDVLGAGMRRGLLDGAGISVAPGGPGCSGAATVLPLGFAQANRLWAVRVGGRFAFGILGGHPRLYGGVLYAVPIVLAGLRIAGVGGDFLPAAALAGAVGGARSRGDHLLVAFCLPITGAGGSGTVFPNPAA